MSSHIGTFDWVSSCHPQVSVQTFQASSSKFHNATLSIHGAVADEQTISYYGRSLEPCAGSLCTNQIMVDVFWICVQFGNKATYPPFFKVVLLAWIVHWNF